MCSNDRNTTDSVITGGVYYWSPSDYHAPHPQFRNVTDEVAALRAERDEWKAAAKVATRSWMKRKAEVERMCPVVEWVERNREKLSAEANALLDAYRATSEQEAPGETDWQQFAQDYIAGKDMTPDYLRGGDDA